MDKSINRKSDFKSQSWFSPHIYRFHKLKLFKNKQNNLLFLIIITGLCSTICLLFYTIPNEYKNFKDTSLSERLNVYYNNYHPKFDYFNGIWLMFAGLFFVLITEYLELPNPFIILENKMKIIEKKIKEKLKRKKD